MLKEWINPLYLNKNVLFKIKDFLWNKKHIRIIQLKKFFIESKIDLIFSDIHNSKRQLFYRETYNWVNVPFFEYSWKNINTFMDFIYSSEFLTYLWFFYNKKITLVNTDFENNYLEFYKKWWNNNSKFILQEYNHDTALGWHNDLGSEKVWSIWRFWLYIWKDYKKEEWWFLELWYKLWETMVTYDKIIPYYNSIFLLVVEEKAYHRVWKINTNKFNRKFFTKEIFNINNL